MRLPDLAKALELAARKLGAEDGFEVHLTRPQNPAHGDLATNLAMLLAGRLSQPPQEVAQALVAELDLAALSLEKAEVAGPGFINFSISPELLREGLRQIAKEDHEYGRATSGAGRRVNVEFVSANPTGPLHVGHGRGAAIGDAIARLLACTGHDVDREFYVNDAGAQIEKLVDSIAARYLQLRGEDEPVPEGGYHGEYVAELAREVEEQLGERIGTVWGAKERELVRDHALDRLMAEQKEDLRALRIEFDTFTSERSLYDSGAIDAMLESLESKELLYRSEGAVWVATSRFGDDKDRVLVKSDGSYTYFLPDITYHRDKAARGFNTAIDIWGADHHSYVKRMQSVLEGLGHGPDFFEVVLVQLIRVERGGEEVKLSKRAGDFVTLRDLVEEVGADVTRYFFLERRPQQQMVFDLDLALERSEKNPVYKIQYALARLRSIYRRAGIEAGEIDLDVDLSPLGIQRELDVIKKLLDYPEVVEAAAGDREPHQVAGYLEGLASEVNSWYHAGNRDKSLRVLGVEPPLQSARLVLSRATEIVLRNGLELLGLDTPDRM
ncbi:MAG: arginine--tRNA ligase [Gemmatimonadota bacterium]